MMFVEFIFENKGQSIPQDNPSSQRTSETSQATIKSTSKAGEIKAACFCSIVSFFENLAKFINKF